MRWKFGGIGEITNQKTARAHHELELASTKGFLRICGRCIAGGSAKSQRNRHQYGFLRERNPWLVGGIGLSRLERRRRGQSLHEVGRRKRMGKRVVIFLGLGLRADDRVSCAV